MALKSVLGRLIIPSTYKIKPKLYQTTTTVNQHTRFLHCTSRRLAKIPRNKFLHTFRYLRRNDEGSKKEEPPASESCEEDSVDKSSHDKSSPDKSSPDKSSPDNEDENPARYRYPKELASFVNKQIQAEFNAGMVYLSMACYYGRTDVAMPGCEGFFRKMYFEEQGHALEFIDYQLLRGGVVKLYPLTVPQNYDWDQISVTMGVALEMEKSVTQQLENLLEMAETHDDIHLTDLLTGKCIPDQNRSIQEIGRLFARAKNLEEGGKLGEYFFDRELFENHCEEKERCKKYT